MSEVITEEQRNAEWHQARAGKFTGSKFVDLLARNKKTGKPLKAYDDLIWKIVCERFSGVVDDGPDGYALRWGREVEPFAIEAYELQTGGIVKTTGFIKHSTYDFVGVSPDGLVDEDGGLEIKCPKSLSVHLQRFMDGMPEEHVPQVQSCMWGTGRKWWDFASYHPHAPESHRLLIIRNYRDDEYIANMERETLIAEQLVQELTEKLQRAAA